MVTPHACHVGAGACKVLLYKEPVVWCVLGVVVTPRACHAGAGVCEVLLYIVLVVGGGGGRV